MRASGGRPVTQKGHATLLPYNSPWLHYAFYFHLTTDRLSTSILLVMPSNVNYKADLATLSNTMLLSTMLTW